MLSIRHRFLFVHIPKTGGNSVHTTLWPFSEDEKVVQGSQDGVNRFETRNSLAKHLHKHATLADYQAELPAELFASLRTFSIIRHPFDWAVSWYFSPHRWVGRTPAWDDGAFTDFVAHEMRPVSHYLGSPPPAGEPWGVRSLLRFENLTDDFAAWCREADLPMQPLPRVNASQRMPWADCLKGRLRDQVAEKCQDVLKYAGYAV